MSWNYDEEADVLYVSVGVDIGEGIVPRYDEESKEVVDVTLIGLRARLLRELDQNR